MPGSSCIEYRTDLTAPSIITMLGLSRAIDEFVDDVVISSKYDETHVKLEVITENVTLP